MKKKGISGLTILGVGAILFILLIAFIGFVAIFPGYFSGFGTTVSNTVYQDTGGLVGTPAPPPPVGLKVGEQLLGYKNNIVIMWNNTQPMGTGPELYTGNDTGFINVYALNVTNNENQPITRIVINYTGGPGGASNYPLITPWYTNSTWMWKGWGPVTNWGIANVSVEPHTSVIVYNATALSPSDLITFYFANGSTYTTHPTYIPSAPI